MEWEKVGVIGVDAGLCWIGDPCYILHRDDDKYIAIGKNWREFCSNFENYPVMKQFHYDMGHPGLGFCVSTGYGDGSYDVFVKRNNEGRIAEVKVVFIEKETEME